jgi:hypothetical protein
MIAFSKPYQVETIQWNSNNLQDMKDFLNTLLIGHEAERNILAVSTYSGNRIVNNTDWIIKDQYSDTKILILSDNDFNSRFEITR